MGRGWVAATPVLSPGTALPFLHRRHSAPAGWVPAPLCPSETQLISFALLTDWTRGPRLTQGAVLQAPSARTGSPPTLFSLSTLQPVQPSPALCVARVPCHLCSVPVPFQSIPCPPGPAFSWLLPRPPFGRDDSTPQVPIALCGSTRVLVSASCSRWFHFFPVSPAVSLWVLNLIWTSLTAAGTALRTASICR